jgi:DNA-binding transcriptional regulator YiaG
MSATLELEELAQRVRTRRDLPPPGVCRSIRQAAGVSLDDVARVLGVTRQCVSYWEAGRHAPRGRNRDQYVEVVRTLKDAVA